MFDYTYLYKDEIPLDRDWTGDDLQCDLFISAYNSSERVKDVFDRVPESIEKKWLIIPDYHYEFDKLPEEVTQRCFPSSDNAGNYFYKDPDRLAIEQRALIHKFITEFIPLEEADELSRKRLCIDITGFVKPYMMFLLYWFVELGIRKFDILYSEPDKYKKKELTTFSDGAVYNTLPVVGFQGLDNKEGTDEILIIGAGYDDALIKHAAEKKKTCKKLQIFGFPSLKADMYQENILRASRAQEALGHSPGTDQFDFFAPANDPFVTANVISKIVQDAVGTRHF